MSVMGNLITSSPTTLSWLDEIRTKVERKIPSLTYGEGRYWAFFKRPKPIRNIALLQPQPGQIRIFTRLAPSYDELLQPTPSSSNWEKMYPSIFTLRSEDEIDEAVEIIISSYHEDSKF